MTLVVDILVNAFRLTKANRKPIATVIILFTIPSAILVGAAFHSGASLSSLTASSGESDSDLSFLSLVLDWVILRPFMFAVLVRIASWSMLGRPSDAKAAIGNVLPMLPRLVPITVMTGLALLGVGLLGIIPAILTGPSPVGVLLVVIGLLPCLIVATLLSSVISIVVVEGASVFNAIRRSSTLMKTRLLPYMGIYVVGALIGAFLFIVAALVPAALANELQDSAPAASMVLRAFATILGATVAVPIIAMMPVLIYFDSLGVYGTRSARG